MDVSMDENEKGQTNKQKLTTPSVAIWPQAKDLRYTVFPFVHPRAMVASVGIKPSVLLHGIGNASVLANLRRL